MFTYLDPIFVYLIDPSITDQGGIDTHRHPFASWYATLQNTPRGHPEQQVRLGKRARTATPSAQHLAQGRCDDATPVLTLRLAGCGGQAFGRA